MILKLQYISQVLFVLGSGVSLSAASIALRELQSERFDTSPDENGLNGEAPLPVGLDEPNLNNTDFSSNSNPDTETIVKMAQQMEAMKQQIAELEHRLEDR
ncbi:hypothetical protein [Salicibibacter kimchii]|uniref:Uncharacterized protein n=1 Tax=Salicibibacter kimchii TaxID=2099786 RepID=A0A345BX80_9BACI|nr:hypothetical protein [Salicibibacter kimchii]AXF55561.1 hypothetical protein DT065_05690 [Salicibibacter kimchii]